jgi:hypothetical protein
MVAGDGYQQVSINTTSSLVGGYQCFGGIFCLHLQY